MALGSGSTTAPSTSIASFFATLRLPVPKQPPSTRCREGGEPKRPPTEAEGTVYGHGRHNVHPRLSRARIPSTAPLRGPGGASILGINGEGVDRRAGARTRGD